MEVGFEVVAVALFLFGEFVGVDGVGVVPAFVGAFEHAFFSSGVVGGVDVLAAWGRGYREWNLVSLRNCRSSFRMITSA